MSHRGLYTKQSVHLSFPFKTVELTNWSENRKHLGHVSYSYLVSGKGKKTC